MDKKTILLINSHDKFGGAARISLDIFNGLKSRGHHAYLAVANKFLDNPSILKIPYQYSMSNLNKMLLREYEIIFKKGKNILEIFTEPMNFVSHVNIFLRRNLDRLRGHESMRYPGVRKLFPLLPEKPDILHLHNLHQNYFDLRILQDYSWKVPAIITLHDEWLLTGHCAYSLGCERWKTGCGDCPDLTIYPSLKKDGTKFNWLQKQSIYKNSRLYITSPSEWLMRRAKQSMLTEGMADSRVIPNGVDQSIFKPANKKLTRKKMGLDPDAFIVLFLVNGDPINERFKDFTTINKTITCLLKHNSYDKRVVVLGVGWDGLNKIIKHKCFLTRGYTSNKTELANYYQAADVFLHAAITDNFPTTIIESLSCGTPVIATAVGGIPEQIEEGINGFLVNEQDVKGMIKMTENIISNDKLLNRLVEGAIETSHPYYGLERMVDDYVSWYEYVENDWKKCEKNNWLMYKDFWR